MFSNRSRLAVSHKLICLWGVIAEIGTEMPFEITVDRATTESILAVLSLSGVNFGISQF